MAIYKLMLQININFPELEHTGTEYRKRSGVLVSTAEKGYAYTIISQKPRKMQEVERGTTLSNEQH